MAVKIVLVSHIRGMPPRMEEKGRQGAEGEEALHLSLYYGTGCWGVWAVLDGVYQGSMVSFWAFITLTSAAFIHHAEHTGLIHS